MIAEMVSPPAGNDFSSTMGHPSGGAEICVDHLGHNRKLHSGLPCEINVCNNMLRRFQYGFYATPVSKGKHPTQNIKIKQQHVS